MECKQERGNCKQFIGTHKLRCQMDTKKNIQNNSPYKRSRHNIKSKTMDGNKCKKCQEKAKNKDNQDVLFHEKEIAKYAQLTHKKKEKMICNPIKPQEVTKFNEKIDKHGSKMKTKEKEESNVIVKTDDLSRNKHLNNKKKIQKYHKVPIRDQSDSSIIKQSKSGMENPYARQKKIQHAVSNNCNRKNPDSRILGKKSETQKLNNVNKQEDPVAVEVQPISSTYSTSTKDSIKATLVEEQVNNNIDIYESEGKLKTETLGGPVCNTDNHLYQHETEDITKHKNITNKEYLLAETGKQIEELICKMRIQNETQRANTCKKENKKKSRFSNTYKCLRREETEKKPQQNKTLNCDIYENSIDGTTPRSQKSLSDSFLRRTMKMFKYKPRKNKMLSSKYSNKSLSNNKKTKSLQSIKQNNLSKRFQQFNQNKNKQFQELISDTALMKSPTKPENLGNDSELQKYNIHNTDPKCDTDKLSICTSLVKINQETVVNEDQWCFVDPGLYSCDSEVILEDGPRTIDSSTHKFTSPDNSNESGNNKKICKSSFSVSDISSAPSLEESNEKFLEINTLECYSNGKDIEPMIYLKTIQNEYNKVKSNPNEGNDKNELVNNDVINHSSNEDVENNISQRLIQKCPYQSAVTLISDFGSKSSSDNQKQSDCYLTQLDYALKNTDISLTGKKDAAVSASTSYEIFRKTKFMIDKAVMCYEIGPSKVKNQRREKMKKIQQNNQRENKRICGTFLKEKNNIHHSASTEVPDILNQTGNKAIVKNVSHHRKFKGIYSEKRQPGRNTKHYQFSNREIMQSMEENKTDTYIRQEELEDVKIKFKDNFTVVYDSENVKSRQPKSFWNTIGTGGRRLVRFLQDAATLKYCFKNSMFK